MLIGTGLIGILITALVICLVYFLLKLLIERAPFVSAEAKTWLSYLLLAVVVVWIICIVLGFAGYNIKL